jgi:hypothetical protein
MEEQAPKKKEPRKVIPMEEAVKRYPMVKRVDDTHVHLTFAAGPDHPAVERGKKQGWVYGFDPDMGPLMIEVKSRHEVKRPLVALRELLENAEIPPEIKARCRRRLEKGQYIPFTFPKVFS